MSPRDELLRLVNGYQVSQALHVAATLGIADRLKDGARPVGALALSTRCDADALYRLLRALASVGVFREHEDRRFSLTPLGEQLRSDVETSCAPWASLIGRTTLWNAWGELMHSVQTGENAFTHLHGRSVWAYRADHPEESVAFDRAMTANSRNSIEPLVASYPFGSLGHVADIGGGKGELLAGVLAAYPALRGTLFDLAHVVENAKALLEGRGVVDRCRIVAGSFFESVPAGADAYLLRLVIHDWADEEALDVLRICRKAMAGSAKLLLVERLVGPINCDPTTKFADLNMLVTPGGRERTESEYIRLLSDAGFDLVSVRQAGGPFSLLEATSKQ